MDRIPVVCWIVADDDFHYVLTRHPRELAGELDRIDVIRPRTFTFCESEGQFKLWTMLFMGTVPRTWEWELFNAYRATGIHPDSETNRY